jgi:hypothetical protein
MTANSFPHYLGYGIINKDSYRKENEKEYVGYVYKDQTVMTAEITPTGAMIEEHYNGKRLSMSFGKTLQRAVFQHYLASDQLKSHLHLDWINEVVGIGNIYAEMIQKSNQTVLYFPAVYLIEIRIPISNDKLSLLEMFLGNPEVIKLNAKAQEATIITRYEDINENLTVPLLTICTPIAFTVQTLKLIKSSGLISIEKRLRGIVGQARASNGTVMRNFIGAPTDNWKSYSILYQSTI